MTRKSAMILGYGLGWLSGQALVALTTVWYERYWLPRIAGED